MATITDQERDTVLAALRCWQQVLKHGQHFRLTSEHALDLLEISEANGEPLDPEQIDALCERLNAPATPVSGHGAPDLLAALRAIRARIAGDYNDPDLLARGPLLADRVADVARFADAAIAKAEGREPAHA